MLRLLALTLLLSCAGDLDFQDPGPGADGGTTLCPDAGPGTCPSR